eukprot:CAMPEP_0196654764 /NCGR_PEP_ID=MMETSP1086-20130531/4486_1 /TAXON_ID=77921 /ORGANISM="Cyanoptyche  gloeocystis , Strain SAG4.97" /LENGTH=371 /DNA_ID=CAMNT_0041986705 /DNA_START=259 /DNA_END=1374 /DNA_ORIENTATION=+
MEDRHVLLKNLDLGTLGSSCAFLGVYDGHGGREAADFLAENLHVNVTKSAFFPKDLPKSFHDAFLKTDDMLLSESTSINSGAGSTAVLALVTEDSLVVANAGDSRCVMSRAGKAIDMSTDHTPFRPDEYSRIKKAGGWVDHTGYLNGYISMSRALGDADFKRHLNLLFPDRQFAAPLLISDPEVRIEKISCDDEFVILACDGLWKRMSSGRAVKIVRKSLIENQNVQKACEQLVLEAINRDTTDNVTAMVVMLQRPTWMKDASISGGMLLGKDIEEAIRESTSSNNLSTVTYTNADTVRSSGDEGDTTCNSPGGSVASAGAVTEESSTYFTTPLDRSKNRSFISKFLHRSQTLKLDQVNVAALRKKSSGTA